MTAEELARQDSERVAKEIGLADKNEIVIEYHEGPDRHGRRFFTMYWWSEDFHLGPMWCGQCFFCDPQTHKDSIEQAGLTVREIDRCRRD